MRLWQRNCWEIAMMISAESRIFESGICIAHPQRVQCAAVGSMQLS
jgi:hypothetical protein